MRDLAPEQGCTRRPRRRRLWVAIFGIFASVVLAGVVIAVVPPWREQVMTAVLLSSGMVTAPSAAPDAVLCTSLHPRWSAHSAHRAHGLVVEPGRVRGGTLVSTALRGARRPYYIYLPPGYDMPTFQRERYPVVYLLHGAPGRAHDWTWGAQIDVAANRLISDCSIAPMIIVMPDGNGGLLRDTQYVNRWDGKENDATYIARDVVGFVDLHFRTLRDPRFRAIMGNSEGGYGAVNLTMQYPNVFSTAASFTGYFRADPHEVASGDNPFGHDPRMLRANSPIVRVATLSASVRHRLHIFIYDGANDSDYAPKARAFNHQLARYGVPHYWDNRDTEPVSVLYHTWIYWRDSARDALTRVSALFVSAGHGRWPGMGASS